MCCVDCLVFVESGVGSGVWGSGRGLGNIFRLFIIGIVAFVCNLWGLGVWGGVCGSGAGSGMIICLVLAVVLCSSCGVWGSGVWSGGLGVWGGICGSGGLGPCLGKLIFNQSY